MEVKGRWATRLEVRDRGHGPLPLCPLSLLLQLGLIFDPNGNDSYNCVTGWKLPTTQDRICYALGLDKETFLAAVSQSTSQSSIKSSQSSRSFSFFTHIHIHTVFTQSVHSTDERLVRP